MCFLITVGFLSSFRIAFFGRSRTIEILHERTVAVSQRKLTTDHANTEILERKAAGFRTCLYRPYMVCSRPSSRLHPYGYLGLIGTESLVPIEMKDHVRGRKERNEANRVRSDTGTGNNKLRAERMHAQASESCQMESIRNEDLWSDAREWGDVLEGERQTVKTHIN